MEFSWTKNVFINKNINNIFTKELSGTRYEKIVNHLQKRAISMYQVVFGTVIFYQRDYMIDDSYFIMHCVCDDNSLTVCYYFFCNFMFKIYSNENNRLKIHHKTKLYVLYCIISHKSLHI